MGKVETWIKAKNELPKSGQLIKCRIKGEEGYCGRAKFTKSEGAVTTVEHRNRTVKIIWKFDEWLPVKE